MSLNLRQKGWEGEKIAQAYLLEQGYEILKTNWYTRFGEADIIAQSPDKMIVVVEVKTYRPQSSIDPRTVISSHKQQRLVQIARYFMMKHQLDEVQFRFDLIVVEKDKIAHHLENIVS